MRLGAWPCILKKGSRAAKAYGTERISERHRHRYEVNNKYRTALADKGMILSGLSPDGKLVEMIELEEHPWFVATQAHPEFKSQPLVPHPLFKAFVGAALEYEEEIRSRPPHHSARRRRMPPTRAASAAASSR